jgi:hypothetical protein
MIDHNSQHMDEFFDLHRQELGQTVVAKTSLFIDYVTYCNDKDYRHHSNLVQFCRAVQNMSSSAAH